MLMNAQILIFQLNYLTNNQVRLDLKFFSKINKPILIFTSSEEDISSISIDDVSSDVTDDDCVTDDEIWDEVNESVQDVVIVEKEAINDDLIESDNDECSSLDSDLSWFQEHYCNSEDDSRYDQAFEMLCWYVGDSCLSFETGLIT